MMHPTYQRSYASGEGARRFGGRWNMVGVAALYLATDHATAIAEYYQGTARPGTLAPYRVTAAAVADLTDGKGAPVDSRVADACIADWKAIARIEGGEPPSWALAQELIVAGAEGALLPSTQNRGGTNLVLWRWGEGDAAEGARLTLLDPERALG